jgi:hypothetical protein
MKEGRVFMGTAFICEGVRTPIGGMAMLLERV